MHSIHIKKLYSLWVCICNMKVIHFDEIEDVIFIWGWVVSSREWENARDRDLQSETESELALVPT